jgi:hypothetical protein
MFGGHYYTRQTEEWRQRAIWGSFGGSGVKSLPRKALDAKLRRCRVAAKI